MGIEPTLRAWEAPVLPLNYTREILIDGSSLHAQAELRIGKNLHLSPLILNPLPVTEEGNSKIILPA